MRQIIIFAGTCASGKTTIIEKITQGEIDFDNQIKIDKSYDWDFIQYKHYQEKKQANQVDSHNVILHYDIYGQHIVMQNDFEKLSRLLSEFDHISIVTLTTSPKELKKRVKIRFIKAIMRMALNPLNYKLEIARCRRHYQIYKNYKNPQVVENLYKDWFNYTRTVKADKHWILNSDIKNEYPIREAFV